MLAETLANARRALLQERNVLGYWEGELSSSALSTATAVTALTLIDAGKHRRLIQNGLDWLTSHQNKDGGWGDTVLSLSNLSTTLLCWSAIGLADSPQGTTDERRKTVERAEAWIRKEAGDLEPEHLAAKVAAHYGKDRTFSVPILMHCALSGRLGPEPEAWNHVRPLPFELAAFPRRWYAALRLPVVSYALPALIAIGYARFFHAPPSIFRVWIRRLAWKRVSKLLGEIQPESGGFLEATPLTSFVSMALASSGQLDHPVIPKAEAFLEASARSDGSWPIDTNLATWCTTLATKALLVNSSMHDDFSDDARRQIRDWLWRQQYRVVHPYTVSPPGGWAWTDLPGGVPDADDTAGALLALHRLREKERNETSLDAAQLGIDWLVRLQNRDGGIPTFCRGWGTLPFDRSSPDLTAHTVRAWHAWLPELNHKHSLAIIRTTGRALDYLRQSQDADGAWTPLWFGNQHAGEESNRTYGTAQVLLALADCLSDGIAHPECVRMTERAVAWLLSSQAASGGWSGDAHGRAPCSIEETALALNALAAMARTHYSSVPSGPLYRAVRYLEEATASGTRFPASPIGFYFAKLWYYEKLYPLIWTVEALERVAPLLELGDASGGYNQ